ncbi:hypothetical protein LOD99_8867 [Oopsacas minuta]|uniref:Uncharacterized protein n=1 Tax=Oopsacas minuta TaxID=111878 RepID=A0AAV7JEG4_9METZ|nr:hypothetical protein LOD99_8867 [Oopsacas minuta]
MILPPNSSTCAFHIGWRIILNTTKDGQFERLWLVDSYAHFRVCNTTNAIIFEEFTGVYEFSLSPGIFSFDSVYYFFSTSNEPNFTADFCKLKLSFLLKPVSSVCNLQPECDSSSLVIIQTATNNITSIPTIFQIDYFNLTTLQLFVIVAIGIVGIFAFCMCLIPMAIYVYFHREKRIDEEISIDFEDEIGLEEYLKRFLILEDDFQVDKYSEPNSPFKDSALTVTIPQSSVLSCNNIYRAPSVTTV